MVQDEEKRVVGENKNMWDITAVYFEASLRKALNDLGKDPSTVGRVASLGYGMFFEAGALGEVFPNAKIEGFDKEAGSKLLYASGVLPSNISLKLGDLTEPETLGKDQYDLLVARNPDVHRLRVWEKIFGNCFSAIKSGGALLVTGSSEVEINDSARLLDEARFHILSKGQNPNAIPADEPVVCRDRYLLVARKP